MKLDSSSFTLWAFLIGPGTVLFSLRSKLLRLQTEMPCARADQVREIYGITRILHGLFRDKRSLSFLRKHVFTFP